jgi:hypothetical protein
MNINISYINEILDLKIKNNNTIILEKFDIIEKKMNEIIEILKEPINQTDEQ